jgi:hypothetical protein
MTEDSWKVKTATPPPPPKPKRRRRMMITGLLTGLCTIAGFAFAWTVSVQPANNAAGYGKSGNLPTVTISTVDVSASLTGDIYPNTSGTGCATPANCGSISVKFHNPYSQPIHLDSLTFAPGPYGPANCNVVQYAPFQKSIDVTVPAGGDSTTLVLPGLLSMDANAPDSCANTVFTIPITGLTGS